MSSAPDHGERDRAALRGDDDKAFLAWCAKVGYPMQAVPLSAMDAWRAGAAHGRADSRAELERVRADLKAETERNQRFGAAYNALEDRHVEVEAELKRIKTPTPPPDSALRERVVEAAMAEWHMHRDHTEPTVEWNSTTAALWRACAALDAATPKPTDAVREAAGRLRAVAADMSEMADKYDEIRHEIVRTYATKIRAVLSALDSARGEGGGE